MATNTSPEKEKPPENQEADSKKESPPPLPSPPPIPQNSSRYRTLYRFTYLLLGCGAVWFLLWFFYFQYHEWTDDAYANGNMINLNSAVDGSVVAYYADDTDLVTEGQLLVKLDSTAYQAAYERELAALGETVLQVRQLYDQVLVKQANVETKRIEVARAQLNYDDRLQVVDSGAVSNENFIHARDDLLAAESALRQAEFELQVACDARGATAIEQHPQIEEEKARVRIAYYNLYHCNIYAPHTGYIALRSVDVGEWVNPTIALMAILPQDYVWVDANFKETQLTYMRIGQKASVEMDIYGSKVVYEGKVLGIASGTGSVFSLIPPQNATGNWIKIVQRLPVRISLDPKKLKAFPTRLGLSCEVDVDLSDQNLPMLAQVPPKKPVSTTDVFDIDQEVINKIMDEIICQKLENYGA